MLGGERMTLEEFLALPESADGNRLELIGGVVHVSRPSSSLNHQEVCFQLVRALKGFDNAGRCTFGVDAVLSGDTCVAPDVLWITSARLPVLVPDGEYVRAAPDLIAEVPEPDTEHRDRTVKLDRYSRAGVREYWIVDWRQRTLDVYRSGAGRLELAASLGEGDALGSPLLPGFTLLIAQIFRDLLPAD